MNINHMQRTLATKYQADASWMKKRLQHADSDTAAKRQSGDRVDISGEGLTALREKMSAARGISQPANIGKLSPLNAGAPGMGNDFEKVLLKLGNGSASDDFVIQDDLQADIDALKARFQEDGAEKKDTFDRYMNQMACAWNLLKDRIEEKYAAPAGEKEYYTAQDGSIQELTKEKEQDFQAQTVYHSGSAETDRSAVKKQSTDIREQAYHAFMDAVDENNIGRLKQETGSLNQFRLHLGISSSARNTLNGIWDDYANRKR